MVLHCAATLTISPPAARPCRLHHGACGALPHPAAAPARALGLGDLLRLVGGGGDARADRAVCRVRRRVRYEEDEDEEDDEEWGHNEDVARMERYTEDARDQALLVKARVDDEVEVVLIFKVPSQDGQMPRWRGGCNAAVLPPVTSFPAQAVVPVKMLSFCLLLMRDRTVSQGFSSSLSGGTAADPARSILPERAIIQSVDVVKGPFDPNNIEYLEKGVEWDDFKSRLQ